MLRGEKTNTTTHKTLHTGRCKKNAEFTFSTSSPEVQQQHYFDDSAELNELMANLTLALPAMFFFLFLFFHLRGPRLSQNWSARNLPRQSLLPPSLSPAQRICRSFSGTSSTTPGSRKVSWLLSEHVEEENSKRQQQKTHSCDREAQGAPVQQMQDVFCRHFLFLRLKKTKKQA